MMRTISDVDFTDKRVLMRVDFNVQLDAIGNAHDTYKITAARETVDHILSFPGARVALLSHLGRPEGAADPDLSMVNLADDVARIYGREVLPVCSGFGVCVVDSLEKANDGQIILLENVRFFEEEKKNDQDFAARLAAPFDVYVNDAFGVSHRAHASLEAITEHIDSYAGLWLEKEITSLTTVRDHPTSPSVAIIGGAKIETKIPLISALEKNYDTILVGGLTSVEALEQGLTFSDKVILPSDFADEKKRDIGPDTIATFVEKIAQAKTVVWNGPLGMFEEAPFDKGTRAIAAAICDNADAFSVVGGGESIQALVESGHFDDISFVSTGGGAMLTFLLDDELPAIAALSQ